MESGDFYGSEQSVTMGGPDSLEIAFTDTAGQTTVLASAISVDAGEVVDAAFMSKQALTAFLDETLAEAKTNEVLWSLHLKATMMKVSDPILFGHGVKAYYRSAFEAHADTLSRLGVDPNNGVGDAYDKIGQLSDAERNSIKAALDDCLASGPARPWSIQIGELLIYTCPVTSLLMPQCQRLFGNLGKCGAQMASFTT